MIDVEGPDVLSRYVALLEAQVQPKASSLDPIPGERAASRAYA